MVPRKGLEPPLLQQETDFKSAASTIPPPRLRLISGKAMEATGGFEPPNRGFADLRLRPLGYVAWFDLLVPRAGLEPTRACAHGPLKTACLPIPPPRPTGRSLYHKVSIIRT